MQDGQYIIYNFLIIGGVKYFSKILNCQKILKLGTWLKMSLSSFRNIMLACFLAVFLKT